MTCQSQLQHLVWPSSLDGGKAAHEGAGSEHPAGVLPLPAAGVGAEVVEGEGGAALVEEGIAWVA